MSLKSLWPVVQPRIVRLLAVAAQEQKQAGAPQEKRTRLGNCEAEVGTDQVLPTVVRHRGHGQVVAVYTPDHCDAVDGKSSGPVEVVD